MKFREDVTVIVRHGRADPRRRRGAGGGGEAGG